MIRQIIRATKHPEALDDKDYYGNKRVELYLIFFENIMHYIFYSQVPRAYFLGRGSYYP
jgi:DNA-directed RNA polymerase beta subunit